MQKSIALAKKNLKKYVKDKKYRKVRGSAHSTCNLKYSLPKKIPITITITVHNGYNYGYHFVIKEVTEELEENYLFRRKHWKIHTLYSSNRKRSSKI